MQRTMLTRLLARLDSLIKYGGIRPAASSVSPVFSPIALLNSSAAALLSAIFN